MEEKPFRDTPMNSRHANEKGASGGRALKKLRDAQPKTSGVLLRRDRLFVPPRVTRLDAVVVLEMMEHVADRDVVFFAGEAAAGVGAFGQVGC